jgi:hypothetical protein
VSAKIVSLTDYRHRLRSDGHNLKWRGLTIDLNPHAALIFVDALNYVRVFTSPFRRTALGFHVTTDGMTVTVSGYGIDSARLSNREAVRLSINVATAARAALAR